MFSRKQELGKFFRQGDGDIPVDAKTWHALAILNWTIFCATILKLLVQAPDGSGVG